MHKRLSLLLSPVLLFAFQRFSAGNIVYDVPGGISTQPNNDPRWNSTVQWAAGGGTIIAPNYFITATHLDSSIGMVGSPVSLKTISGGVPNTYSYTATSIQNIPNSDLTIVQINGTFPSTASIIPLYTGLAGSEKNEAVSFLGYGAFQQGTAVTTGGTQNGWLWKGATGVKNYGQNTIKSVDADAGPGGESLLDYQFQNITGSDEAIYSNRDSGGGTFIDNSGVYQLAGVNYGVDEFFSKSGTMANPVFTPILGAIYNAAGLYVDNSNTNIPNYVLASSLGITDQHGYASEIAPFYNTIRSDIPEPASLVVGGLGALGFMIFRRPHRCC